MTLSNGPDDLGSKKLKTSIKGDTPLFPCPNVCLQIKRITDQYEYISTKEGNEELPPITSEDLMLNKENNPLQSLIIDNFYTPQRDVISFRNGETPQWNTHQ